MSGLALFRVHSTAGPLLPLPHQRPTRLTPAPSSSGTLVLREAMPGRRGLHSLRPVHPAPSPPTLAAAAAAASGTIHETRRRASACAVVCSASVPALAAPSAPVVGSHRASLCARRARVGSHQPGHPCSSVVIVGIGGVQGGGRPLSLTRPCVRSSGTCSFWLAQRPLTAALQPIVVHAGNGRGSSSSQDDSGQGSDPDSLLTGQPPAARRRRRTPKPKPAASSSSAPADDRPPAVTTAAAAAAAAAASAAAAGAGGGGAGAEAGGGQSGAAKSRRGRKPKAATADATALELGGSKGAAAGVIAGSGRQTSRKRAVSSLKKTSKHQQEQQGEQQQQQQQHSEIDWDRVIAAADDVTPDGYWPDASWLQPREVPSQWRGHPLRGYMSNEASGADDSLRQSDSSLFDPADHTAVENGRAASMELPPYSFEMEDNAGSTEGRQDGQGLWGQEGTGPQAWSVGGFSGPSALRDGSNAEGSSVAWVELLQDEGVSRLYEQQQQQQQQRLQWGQQQQELDQDVGMASLGWDQDDGAVDSSRPLDPEIQAFFKGLNLDLGNIDSSDVSIPSDDDTGNGSGADIQTAFSAARGMGSSGSPLGGPPGAVLRSGQPAGPHVSAGGPGAGLGETSGAGEYGGATGRRGSVPGSTSGKSPLSGAAPSGSGGGGGGYAGTGLGSYSASGAYVDRERLVGEAGVGKGTYGNSSAYWESDGQVGSQGSVGGPGTVGKRGGTDWSVGASQQYWYGEGNGDRSSHYDQRANSSAMGGVGGAAGREEALPTAAEAAAAGGAQPWGTAASAAQGVSSAVGGWASDLSQVGSAPATWRRRVDADGGRVPVGEGVPGVAGAGGWGASASAWRSGAVESQQWRDNADEQQQQQQQEQSDSDYEDAEWSGSEFEDDRWGSEEEGCSGVKEDGEEAKKQTWSPSPRASSSSYRQDYDEQAQRQGGSSSSRSGQNGVSKDPVARLWSPSEELSYDFMQGLQPTTHALPSLSSLPNLSPPPSPTPYSSPRPTVPAAAAGSGDRGGGQGYRSGGRKEDTGATVIGDASSGAAFAPGSAHGGTPGPQALEWGRFGVEDGAYGMQGDGGGSVHDGGYGGGSGFGVYGGGVDADADADAELEADAEAAAMSAGKLSAAMEQLEGELSHLMGMAMDGGATVPFGDDFATQQEQQQQQQQQQQDDPFVLAAEEEIHRITRILEVRESELATLTQELEETKAQLALMRARAEAELELAQQAVMEKDMKLKAAEAAMGGLRKVAIEYWGAGSEVKLAGSFNGWRHHISLMPDPTSEIPNQDGSRGPMIWDSTLWLYPGAYEIKFVVDGEWTVDPRREVTMSGVGQNNVLVVEDTSDCDSDGAVGHNGSSSSGGGGGDFSLA